MEDLLQRLERYQILADLNDENYHSNCFIYALKQTQYVSKDIIDTVKSHISHTYIKTKNIGLLYKKVGLNFLVRKPEDHPSRQSKIKLEKLGQKKNNYLIGAKTSTIKPIELLFYENHWMLFDDDIKYKGKKYNTYQFLKQLIKDDILKPMTMNDDTLINSKREVYLSTPSKIKLAEFNPELFEFQQFLPQSEDDFKTKEVNAIFYADFECTTDGECHQPYLCCLKKRGFETLLSFTGKRLC